MGGASSARSSRRSEGPRSRGSAAGPTELPDGEGLALQAVGVADPPGDETLGNVEGSLGTAFERFQAEQVASPRRGQMRRELLEPALRELRPAGAPVEREALPGVLHFPGWGGREVGRVEQHHIEPAQSPEEVRKDLRYLEPPALPLDGPQGEQVEVRGEHARAGPRGGKSGESPSTADLENELVGVDHGLRGEQQAVLPDRVDMFHRGQVEVEEFHGNSEGARTYSPSGSDGPVTTTSEGPNPLPDEAAAPGEMQVPEGSVTLRLPQGSLPQVTRGPASRAPVFYNPGMSFTRDLDVAFLTRWSELKGRRMSVWEPLAASGVRSLRLLQETPAVERLSAGELQPEALRFLRRNLGPDPRATVFSHDAREPAPEGPYDWVDLDPYGTPAPFLPAALTSLAPGGVLAVTATDTAVLAGPERSTCEQRYGARPLRNYLCREAGLRILIGHVARRVHERGGSIRPLAAYARDHHFRAYLEVRAEPAPLELKVVPWEGYPGPPIDRGHRGGPLWVDRLFDPDFLSGTLPPLSADRPREISRWLELFRGEAAHPLLFYYTIGEVAKALHLDRPPSRPELFRRLTQAGYAAVPTHLDPEGWRTDARWQELAGLLTGKEPSVPRAEPPR